MNDSCPVCQSDSRNIIGKPRTNSISVQFVDTDYKVVQCTNCQLYYVTPPIAFTTEEWSKLYNSEYFSDQSKILIKRRKKELTQRFDTAIKLTSSKVNYFRYLDVGAGEGKGLIEAVNRGWEATGVDIVDNRLPDAKIHNINFIESNLMDTNLPEDYFDFIYIDSVVEHVLNPFEYLTKIKSLLKPGGVIYVGVPNEDCLFNSVRKLMFKFTGKENESVKLKPFDSPYHVVGFNHFSLQYFFDTLGLVVLKKRNFGRKFDFLSYPVTSKSFWIDLFFLFPVEFPGKWLKKDIYFEAYLSKP